MAITYNKIATTTLSTAASLVTFDSIPATYTDLKVVLRGIPAGGSGGTYTAIRFNNDLTATYSNNQIYGITGGIGTTRNSTQTDLFLNDTDTSSYSYFHVVDIFSYASSTNKYLLSQSFMNDATTGGINGSVVGLWRNTAIITRVDMLALSGNTYRIGTVATLYGIKAAV
jgi:hypothetical protein